MSDGPAPALHRLAEQVGISPEYVDQTGREVRRTSDETRIAILRAMGLDGSTERSARAAMRELRSRERARLLDPVRVRPRGAGIGAVLRLPATRRLDLSWRAVLTPEHGEPIRYEGTATTTRSGSARIALDARLPDGYHELHVTASVAGKEYEGHQSVVVAPRVGRPVQRVFGVTANLYSVRSAGDWGVGDFSTLAALLEWTGREGGAFVGVNPLHALRNRGWEVSPYSPVSRLFRNSIYLDPAAVPDPPAEALALMADPEVMREREALRASDTVLYERVQALKHRVLHTLHRGFAGGEEYRRYREREGEPLERFATFEALTEHLGAADWHEWPEAYRDPRSAEVARFRAEREQEVDFHRWVQYELDRQLAAAAERGRRAGLRVGLYQDLAIGTSARGADVWSNPHLFLESVSVGAPPDDLGPSGQNWGLPPLDPRGLREERYRFWIDLLRASFRHAGALRIDHVLGLFRQFWIPAGMSGADGAYVRFPAGDLLGILLLEAERHRAVVVGEDLGTVPPEVPPALRKRRILSSRVFYFEREGERYRPAAEYEPAALATANTHDLPPMAGFWSGRDLELRRRIGAIGSDGDLANAMREREGIRRAMLQRLAADGALPASEEPSDGAELRGAVHAFLCSTPAAMVGISLEDLVGETEPVNLPGVAPDRYPSWTRRLRMPVEALAGDPAVRIALRGSRSRRGTDVKARR